MSEERKGLDEGPSEEASGQEDNFDGNKTGLSETYDTRDFCPGIRIEAQDFDGKWHPAKVADVDWTENEVLVHFENLNTKFDEWIPMDSSRLRSLPKPLAHTGKESVKFVQGEEVMAVWSPYQKYPAKIQAVLPNDRYDVLFYDGFLKRLKAHKISKLGDGIVRSDVPNFSDIGTKEERRERKRKINVAELFHMNKRSKKKGLVHSKEMKTYPVNKSRAKGSLVKKSLAVPEEKDAAAATSIPGAAAEASAKPGEGKPPVPTGNSTYMARSLVGTIPAAVKVKYLDGRTEMWSKQLYQRSEGRTAGKLDIVILNPQGRKFRSRNEIMKYCEENGIIYTHESFDFSAKGRPKSKSVVQGAPPKADSSLDSGDKISLKKLRRKSNPYDVAPTPSPGVAQTPPAAGAGTGAGVPSSLDGHNVAPDDKVFIGDVEVVVENGKFICPVKVCGKHFRRENLLHMHMKHYHPEFSKYLDYTPSVTDLAYMRTVGSLETGDSSPSSAKKPVQAADKSDKTPSKVEKSSKLSGSMDGSKDFKKTSHKTTDGLNDSRLLSKLTTQSSPSSPKIALGEASETKTPDADSTTDGSSYQTYKEAKSHLADSGESPGRLSQQTETGGGDAGAGVVGGSASSQSTAASKSSVRHSRFLRQKKNVRIRGSFSDQIKRKKYMGQGDHSRTSARASGLDASAPGSVPSSSASSSSQFLADEDQSNASVTSQTQPTESLKLRLKIPTEVSGEKLPANNSGGALLNDDGARRPVERDPKSAYVLLEKALDLGRSSGSGVGGGGRHSDSSHPPKRKRHDSRSGGSRSKSRKKVLFESMTYAKWRDSAPDSRCGPEVGLERRSKDKSKPCSRYIHYLNGRGPEEPARGAAAPDPVIEDGDGAGVDAGMDSPFDLDHTEGTEDSKSPFTVENEKVEKLRRNEIINCTCGVTEEDGLMIQCDLCLCWQHGHCMNILRDSDVPDKYICSICKNPFRGRASMKYVHDQEWLKEGTLPCLSFRSKRDDVIEQRQTILKRSYDLSGSISLLSQVIHSLRVKVNIAEKKDHPKLWLWAKKWIEKKPTRIIEDVKEEKASVTGSVSDKQEVLLPGEEQQLPKVPEPEAPIDSAECRLNLLDHLIHYQTLVDARLSCIESLVAELESMQDDAVDDEGPDRYPRTKATIQMILRDLTTMKKIAVI